MTKRIAVLAGDGIGPEIVAEALKILDAVGHFHFEEGWIGGAAWERLGSHFPKETENLCARSDAILFGSIGGPPEESHLDKWKNCERNALLALRQRFGFSLNLRPVKGYPTLSHYSVLRQDILEKGIDILCVRELSGDIYFGEHQTRQVGSRTLATDLMVYWDDTVEGIARQAFEAARKRRQKVTSVDKANVLDCSRLWRDTVNRVAQDYPDCQLEHLLVDNAAMQLIQRPHSFDVLLMPNLFGDILSDEASVLSGSLGLLPSASLNVDGFGLYEPSGGSAPSLAGKSIANPIGQILSAAMMLKYSFHMDKEHDLIEKAVERCLQKGVLTADLTQSQSVSTQEMGNAIIEELTAVKS